MNKRLRKYLSAFLSAAVTSGMVGSSNVLAKWEVGPNLRGINFGGDLNYDQTLVWQDAEDEAESEKSSFSDALSKTSVTEIMNVDSMKNGVDGDIVKDAVLERQKIDGVSFNASDVNALKDQMSALKSLRMGPDGSLLKSDNDGLHYVVVKKSDVANSKLKLDVNWKLSDSLSYNAVKSAISGNGEENLNNWCALCVGDPGWVEFTNENKKTAKAGEDFVVASTGLPQDFKSKAGDWFTAVESGNSATVASKLGEIIQSLGNNFQIKLIRHGIAKAQDLTSLNCNVDDSSTPPIFAVNAVGSIVGFQLKYADVIKYLNNKAVHIAKSFDDGNLNSIFKVSVGEEGLGGGDTTPPASISELIEKTPGARSYALAHLTSAAGAQPADRLKYKNKDAVLAYDRSTGDVYVTSLDDNGGMNSPEKVGRVDSDLTLAQFSMVLNACYGIDLHHVHVSDYVGMMLLNGKWQYDETNDLLRFPSGKYLAPGDNLESDPGVAWYKLSFLLSKNGGSKLGNLITPEAIQTIKGLLKNENHVLDIKKKLLSRGLPDAAKLISSFGVGTLMYLFVNHIDDLLAAYHSYAEDSGVDQLEEGEDESTADEEPY